MAEKPKHKPEHLLMEALDFTDEDLAANREGYLTKRQLLRLSQRQNSWTMGVVLAAIGSVFLCAFAIMDGIRIGDTVSSRVGIIGLIAILAGGFVLYTWTKGARFAVDLRQGELEAVEGRVALDVISQGSSGNAYTVQIEDRTFAINKPIFLAFKNGDPYRIYYAPHSRTILSAEWLREA
jgi:hypothetical protein